MTTRETTALLPLNDIDLNLSLGDRAMVLAYGAVQWPWLLRSLHGGRKADKVALLDYLDLPLDALPNLGSWKADTNFLWHIVSAIEEIRPQRVVELGCGASTLVVARLLVTISMAHSPRLPKAGFGRMVCRWKSATLPWGHRLPAGRGIGIN
jgi:hypothetical protein